jgi:2Fe-2S ferredoxin
MDGNESVGGAVIEESPALAQKLYRITFLRKGEGSVTVEYQPGVTPYHEHGREGSLLDIALNFGIDLEHSCGGNCACTTCHVIVKEGEQNLTEMDEDEEDRIYMADNVTLHSRLGCQAVVRGDVTVEIAD